MVFKQSYVLQISYIVYEKTDFLFLDVYIASLVDILFVHVCNKCFVSFMSLWFFCFMIMLIRIPARRQQIKGKLVSFVQDFGTVMHFIT